MNITLWKKDSRSTGPSGCLRIGCRIKHFLTLLICLVILSGCDSKAIEDIQKDIDQAIGQAVNAAIVETQYNNCHKTYYSYNTDLNIGRSDSDELTNQFLINNNRSALTLDVSSILMTQLKTDKSLRQIGSLDRAAYENSGSFLNSSGDLIPYKISICHGEGADYFVLIQTRQFIFISYVDSGTLPGTVYDMLVLLRTTQVNESQVILDYASDSVIFYQTNIITLFDDIQPESGNVSDYIGDWSEDTSFVRIDQEIDVPEGLPEDDIQDPTEGENPW